MALGSTIPDWPISSTQGDTKTPKTPKKAPHIGLATKSALARFDNSGRLGIIEAAVPIRGTGSNLKPPPSWGADGRQLSEPASPFITNRISTRRVLGPDVPK